MLFGFAFLCSFALGQKQPDSTQIAGVAGLQMRLNIAVGINWNDYTGTPDMITLAVPVTFSSDPRESAQFFLRELGEIHKENSENDRLEFHSLKENKGISYLKFKQTFKGVPVIGGEYVVTVQKGGGVQAALGLFHKEIQLDVVPTMAAPAALAAARQDSPQELRDSLRESRLVVYPKGEKYFLAWELRIPTAIGFGEWMFVVDARTSAILTKQSTVINELPMRVPVPDADVYSRHPSLDTSTTYISDFNVAETGYIQGTYADVYNDATSRAYDEDSHFVYTPSNTHFDEANLYYHIDNFRRNFWNEMSFDEFTQIIAHAHTTFLDGYGNPAPNASYSLGDHHVRFSDGQSVSGFNSFAKEDKIIMHEYTHAVTDFVAHLWNTDNNGYNQTFAIHEGNSDYFAAAFTDRTLINEYACYGYSIYQRDIASPRVANFSQYQQAQYYSPYQIYEPHIGGELWSRCLWDLRSHQGIGWIADYLAYYGLFGIPTTSSFLQYRQAIINADINYFGGAHKKIIEHLFYARGIGPDSLGVAISGPSAIYHADPKGTPPNCYSWTAGATGGTSPYSYTWTGSYGTPSGANYNECFSWNGYGGGSYQYTLRVDVTDAQSNTAFATRVITAHNSGGGPPPEIENHQLQDIVIPGEFDVEQNYPNPFNPETEIRFALPEPSSVTVTVTDMLGREIVTLAERNYGAGYQRVLWRGVDASGRPVGSGVYFCRVTATGESGKQLVKVMKMTLTR